MKFILSVYHLVNFTRLVSADLFFPTEDGLYVGSICQNTGESGICTEKSKCPKAEADVTQYGYHNLTRCRFYGNIETVCCPVAQTRFQTMERKSEVACNNYLKNLSTIVFPQITAGESVNPGELPHMVALAFYSVKDKTHRFRCGGTLISDKYIISAAHCLWNIDRDELKFVRLGMVNVPETTDVMNPLTDVQVKNVSTHPNYYRRKNQNDIALIELEKSVQFGEYIRPACLLSTNDNYPRDFMIAGWGLVNNSFRSDTLQKAFVTLSNFEQCRERYKNIYNVTLLESQICATDNKSDTCTGDSGGPLQNRNFTVPVLVGITSYGPYAECQASDLPTVYTSILSYLDWIESIVWR